MEKYVVLAGLLLCVWRLYCSIRGVALYAALRGDYKAYCIERIVKQQLACTHILLVYHVATTLAWSWMASECLMALLDASHLVQMIVEIAMITLQAISCVVFFVVKMRLMRRYNLSAFFDWMVDYRSKQEVVTEDNDHEVEFLRSYQAVKKCSLSLGALLIAAIVVYTFI